MGLPELLALIQGVIEFPKLVLEFVKLLQKTPEEKHELLIKKMSDEALQFQKEGRPTWE